MSEFFKSSEGSSSEELEPSELSFFPEENSKKGYPLDLLRWKLCQISASGSDPKLGPKLNPKLGPKSDPNWTQLTDFLVCQQQKLEQVQLEPLSFEDRIQQYVDGTIRLAQSQQNLSAVKTVQDVIEGLILKIQLLESGDLEKLQESTQTDRKIYDLGQGIISLIHTFKKGQDFQNKNNKD